MIRTTELAVEVGCGRFMAGRVPAARQRFRKQFRTGGFAFTSGLFPRRPVV